ncbi:MULTISPECIES: virulence RhuM family protein [Sediminibacterium]|uniref:virulence RhuM family protein n=1 Tax=Sediminibacterium TaxID=504481 RepID=UPI000A032021|nr:MULTISPECIES: virulence RhuM family protein [Sediminibacterium]OYY11977.1 MAG: cell filamentation protein Fic [Sphingobacteriia bacterium 35-36-14]OYZ54272.1 MAG: cell filamentation protein Fic [Sphingobacteriia bacterium 24-36-13]OZA65687.1 MAG: cell filamentation protein Fic [Sphingobacteriia bacterium 39-36-14]HQS23751.1 virulence RhuM family protein [Sediminibacterium sp.]HQS34110.1 virulence RhuM family protein [Sediminibacterium sp.]
MSDTPQHSDIIFYNTPTGDVKIEVIFNDETFWLTQKRMAELFGVEVPAINKHLSNIYETGELDEKATISILETVQQEGTRMVKRNVEFYNLDAIIAVGYRVNSHQATQFRIWATKTLREFIIKGFVLDDERLKQGKRFGKDYFDELLERIREIRASERRFYLKITDIYEQCSIDYNKDAEITQKFFKTVQNKLHWAITGKTAAELIADRADASQPNMGLTTWKNAPKGKILKTDIGTAKNYLQEKEIKELERIVTMYLDFAELQAERQIPMKMADWVTRLDAFLQFNEYQILKDAGKVSHEVAMKLAEKEYEKFRIIQDRNFESDFEKEVKKITDKPKKKKK